MLQRKHHANESRRGVKTTAVAPGSQPSLRRAFDERSAEGGAPVKPQRLSPWDGLTDEMRGSVSIPLGLSQSSGMAETPAVEE